MKTNPLRAASGLALILFPLLLGSCVDPYYYGVDHHHYPSRGYVVYRTLPPNYVGNVYYYNGSYYTGGRYQTGVYVYGGRTYRDRYYYKGRYIYGGSYKQYPRRDHRTDDRRHDRRDYHESTYPGMRPYRR